MKNILCFGDSNTWGCVPGVFSRFPLDKRWTGLLAKALGEEYHVIEDGVKGRTVAVDDPHVPFRNGLSSLGYSLLRASPIDLMIVMLGTNDIKSFFPFTPYVVSNGVGTSDLPVRLGARPQFHLLTLTSK